MFGTQIGRKDKTMVEVKAITHEDTHITDTEISVHARGIEYMAEVISIIESLMRGMRENDRLLHAATLKIIAEHPYILLGKKDEDEDKAKAFERFVATAKFREGVN